MAVALTDSEVRAPYINAGKHVTAKFVGAQMCGQPGAALALARFCVATSKGVIHGAKNATSKSKIRKPPAILPIADENARNCRKTGKSVQNCRSSFCGLADTWVHGSLCDVPDKSSNHDGQGQHQEAALNYRIVSLTKRPDQQADPGLGGQRQTQP